jgi:histidine triad (HIT) family protein
VSDCLFCRIVAGEIPADTVHDDDLVLAFPDINPQAPVHVLVIPKRHVASADDLGESDSELLGRLFAVIRDVARAEGIAQPGYRVVTNIGADAGQSVAHLHFHVLGGRRLGWPPG